MTCRLSGNEEVGWRLTVMPPRMCVLGVDVGLHVGNAVQTDNPLDIANVLCHQSLCLENLLDCSCINYTGINFYIYTQLHRHPNFLNVLLHCGLS